MQAKDLVSKVAKMCEQPLQQCDCTLWDITFEKEGTRFVLTVYIDHEDGVDVSQCEVVSRYIDPLLDAEEFASLPNYVLSVSSAGLERHITKPEHFQWAMGKVIDVTFYKAVNGEKTIADVLNGFDENTVTIGDMSYNRTEVASIKLHFEF